MQQALGTLFLCRRTTLTNDMIGLRNALALTLHTLLGHTEWLVLAKLFPPLNHPDALGTEATDRHGQDLLGFLAVAVVYKGEFVSVRWWAAFLGTRAYFRHLWGVILNLACVVLYYLCKARML